MKPITTFLQRIFGQKKNEGDNFTSLDLQKADHLLNDLVLSKKVPGLAITVLKNGKSLFQKGYGYADLERNIVIDPKKTIFRIASASKPIAATALAFTVHEGLIDLDASFYKYVPYFPRKKWDFTIRQLACHTAGIRGYRGKEYALNKPYTIKESIEIFSADELLFEPGTDYQYNSYDWVLISLAMQEASGTPFEEYVKEKVLNPLGMSNTFAPNVTSVAHSDYYNRKEILEHSRYYNKNSLGFRKAIPVNNYFKLAGGGYLSTSEDIAKFGQSLLDDKLFHGDLKKEFLTAQMINGSSTYYGLGWQVSEDKKGRLYYGHVGNGVGGYSNFFVYPEQQMVFSILINCTNPNVQEELNETIDVLIARSVERIA